MRGKPLRPFPSFKTDEEADAVKAKAKERGIPFTRYIRMLMERDVTR